MLAVDKYSSDFTEFTDVVNANGADGTSKPTVHTINTDCVSGSGLMEL